VSDRRSWGNPPVIDAPFFPQLAGDVHGVDPGRFPPGSLVTGALHLAVVRAATVVGLTDIGLNMAF
jgi:hypothetical protein